jgi:hypothetical protein
MINAEKPCTVPFCLKMVYAKDLCKPHYTKARRLHDYEVERLRREKELGRPIARRASKYRSNKGPRIVCEAIPSETRAERRQAMWQEIQKVFEAPPPRHAQCGMKSCEKPVHCTGLCRYHYDRYRYLVVSLGYEKPDDRRQRQATETDNIPVDEWNLRQQAAQMGIPPGKLAMERGLKW